MAAGGKPVSPPNKAKARALLREGVDPRTVANVFGLTIKQVADMHPGVDPIGTEEGAVEERARGLALQAIERARNILTSGAPSHQIMLIRSLVLPMLKQTKPGEIEDPELTKARGSFAALMAEVRGVDEPRTAAETVEDSD